MSQILHLGILKEIIIILENQKYYYYLKSK